MQGNEIRELADEIRAQLHDLPSIFPEYCIGRVNRELSEAHWNSYIPTTISIGPLHHDRRDLNTMEEYKRRYTKSFLEQSPQLILEDYLKAMNGLEEKARRCYGGQVELSSKRFKSIMLFDGCFIIQLFLRFKKEVPGSEDDPIFSRNGFLNRIKHDLILFENQLPFFVLQCLFNISTVYNGGPSLVELALHFFNDIIPGHDQLGQEKGADMKHLLDLLRHSYAPTSVDKRPFDNEPEVLIYSATDLKLKAGIKFRKGKTGSLLDIMFHSNGSMEIPRLKLHVETETVFRNLIAFEQSCERSNTYITDYISFIGSLINDWDDADLLMDMGIIESHLSYDPFAVVNLFRALGRELIVRNFYYSRICKRVNLHCISPQQPWVDTFVQDCCSYFYVLGIFLLLMWLAAFGLR